MSPRERELRKRLRDDYQFFARKCLMIRPKSGTPGRLVLNRAQEYLHGRLQGQLETKGRVRAIIVKGRQQGVSTYVESRFYWKVTHRFGVRAFILTHAQDATDNLFEMVERFHENNNPLVKPLIGTSNAKELNFKALDSGYKVGTAGTVGIGRSDTMQFFHGSEVGFWRNADTHAAGALQAVPNEAGTEIILESTANGLGTFFAKQWSLAEAGLSEFEAIFIPWFWQGEYRAPVTDDFVLTPEEREYAEAYRLADEQMAWRRSKIIELGEDWMFRQEYPANPAEAFQASGEGSFIKPLHVAKARNSEITVSAHLPIVLGVDPGRTGDRTAIIDRQGRRAGGHLCELWSDPDTMVVAGKIANAIGAIKPKKVFIDVGGLGAGIYDRLAELGYSSIVEAVNFGQRASEHERYANKRAEMYDEARQWFAGVADVRIPNRDDLQADLCAPIWGPGATRVNSSGALLIEDKDHIKKRLHRSPDLGDALALTFAAPTLAPPVVRKERQYYGGSWAA